MIILFPFDLEDSSYRYHQDTLPILSTFKGVGVGEPKWLPGSMDHALSEFLLLIHVGRITRAWQYSLLLETIIRPLPCALVSCTHVREWEEPKAQIIFYCVQLFFFPHGVFGLTVDKSVSNGKQETPEHICLMSTLLILTTSSNNKHL